MSRHMDEHWDMRTDYEPIDAHSIEVTQADKFVYLLMDTFEGVKDFYNNHVQAEEKKFLVIRFDDGDELEITFDEFEEYVNRLRD